MKIPPGWTKEEPGWYTHPEAGGVSREQGGWFVWPIGPADHGGPYRTATQAFEEAEALMIAVQDQQESSRTMESAWLAENPGKTREDYDLFRLSEDAATRNPWFDLIKGKTTKEARR